MLVEMCFLLLPLSSYGSGMAFRWPDDDPNKALCSRKENFYPDICSCGPNGPYATCICTDNHQDLRLTAVSKTIKTIEIKNCNVSIKPKVFKSTQGLASLTLANSSISLDHQSLWIGPVASKISILIRDSQLGDIPSESFIGSIGAISIVNSTIRKLSSSAFSKIRNFDELKLIDTEVSTVDRRAFQELTLDYLEVTRCTFHHIADEGFFVTVKSDVKIIHSKFFDISPRALTFGPFSRYLNVEENTFFDFPKHAIVTKKKDKSKSTFKSNLFRHLAPLSFERLESYGTEFTNNTLLSADPSSLYIPGSDSNVKFLVNIFNLSCSCEMEQWFSHLLSEPDANFSSSHDVLHSIHSTSFCRDKGKFLSVRQYERSFCEPTSSSTTFLTYVSISVALLLVLLVAFAVLCRLRLRKKRQSKDKQRIMVVPDAKIYKETEVEYVIEQVQSIPDDPSSSGICNYGMEMNGTVRQSCPPIMRAQL